MEELVIFPSEKTRVKARTMLIETLLRGDPLWSVLCTKKRHFIYSSFFFFDHIRTSIAKSTSWLFYAGNPWWRFHLWRILLSWWLQLQFSHLPTYLLLWHLQLVNPQSRTESCKIFYCCHSSAWYILCVVIM